MQFVRLGNVIISDDSCIADGGLCLCENRLGGLYPRNGQVAAMEAEKNLRVSRVVNKGTSDHWFCWK